MIDPENPLRVYVIGDDLQVLDNRESYFPRSLLEEACSMRWPFNPVEVWVVRPAARGYERVRRVCPNRWIEYDSQVVAMDYGARVARSKHVERLHPDQPGAKLMLVSTCLL